MIFTFRSKVNYYRKFVLRCFSHSSLKSQNLISSEKSINTNTNIVKDVILYKYENPKFYKYLNIFAICQFGFWNYLALFSFQTLKDAPVSKNENAPWWQKINLGENKYRNTLSFLAFMIGWGILAVSWMVTLRSVRYLILRKGGEKATIVTYSPSGKNRMFTLELKNINCRENREASKATIPLKIKGHYLHYMLDMRGEFRNPTLFDYTIGLKRW